jgi:predicted HicB family RNase H-like nuclease
MNLKRIETRVSESDYQALQRIAKAEGISINEVVRTMILSSLDMDAIFSAAPKNDTYK